MLIPVLVDPLRVSLIINTIIQKYSLFSLCNQQNNSFFAPMQRQVNDMSQTLQAIVEELQLLSQSNVGQQYNLICQLNRNSGAQLCEIRSLRKENAILRERLSKPEQPPIDSNNSSIPPRKENIKSEVKRWTNSLREKSDRLVGGQKGHEGLTRKKAGNVDEIVEHSSNYCICRGHDTSTIEPILEYQCVPYERLQSNIITQSVEHLSNDFRRLNNGLLKCRDYVFKFLESPAIPPDNNASERGIRKLKSKQKISGTFRSDLGTDAFMSILSITDTAWKNKQSPFEAILAVLQWPQKGGVVIC